MRNANRMRFLGKDENGNCIFRPLTNADNKEFELLINKDVDLFDFADSNPNKITAAQRRKAQALISEIDDHWDGGYMPYTRNETEHERKIDFCFITKYDYFSLANCDKDVATAFVQYLVEYCFEHDINFYLRDLHATVDIERAMFLCALHKRCFISGKMQHQAVLHVHHVNAAGRGNKKNIDHRGRYYMILEAKYHHEIHVLGHTEFLKKYHTVPVKLTDELVLKFKLMTQAKMNELDSDPNYEITDWQLPG